ncbi:MAG TPA: hypothetical protein VJ982_03910 [Gemmatimonadota bacterium]|nr:hypothetical protein [Gemmatimonadota bacterium]
MRRHLRKMLMGSSFLVLISFEECVFRFCEFADFEPQICDQFDR